MTTVTLRPSSDGDLSQCAIYPATPTTHFDKVDEETSDDDSTYVQSYIDVDPDTGEPLYTPERDLYNLPDGQIPAGSTINSVTIYVRVRRIYTNCGAARILIKTHAASYETNLAITGTSYVLYSKIYTTNPFTGVAWTLDEINALQVGITLIESPDPYGKPRTIRCTQVYVVVDYTPPVVVKKPIMSIIPLMRGMDLG